MIKDPHTISIQKISKQLNVDPEKGLTTSEAKKRRSIYRENTLKQTQSKNVWLIALDQFLDPVIYVLGMAMILAFAFEEWLEGFAVLAVILITALIGFFMERQAIRSVEALQKMVQAVAYVIRNGSAKRLKARFLVPGDIILLESGDVVPADARLIAHQRLAIKEAVLTGESNQVEKNLDILPVETTLAERSNMVFKGTIVVRGDAKAIVTATGDQTHIGQISSLTQEAHKERSPLEKRLNKLSRWLIGLTLILAILIAISGYFQGKDLFLMVKIGIALAVAAIPEGLPIVATIALARGMVKLSRRKVIIKKLEAVQTLGETTIVCTDKTGTLTENKISVHNLVSCDDVMDLKDFENTKFLSNLKRNVVFSKIIEVAVLCNNIRLEEERTNADSIENALIDFARKTGYHPKVIRNEYPELVETPFDADTKIMVTLNQYKKGYLVCVKGALEQVIDSCDLILTKDGVQPLENKEKWYHLSEKIASEGLRILAFAYRHTDERPGQNDLTDQLVFLGIIGFLDPPRRDIKQAIQTYKDAGIKVVMITGDHPNTARKIAEEIGLLAIEDASKQVIHGKTVLKLENMTPEEENEILNATIFARMVPEQKLDLVHFYQKHNAIVGMIGDGVNDAPALKKADIGIAMGNRGTEAAKEVADVILMDDKFTSTELAIRQGRTIYGNIRHFVVYLLSCNFAEIISVAVASISNLPLPLLPLQILFLNLVTDVFPALALGMGKGDKNIMKQQPRDPKEPIITKKLWASTIIYGLSITTVVIGITIYAHFVKELPHEIVNNMAFYTLVLAQLINVFNIPYRQFSFFKNEVTTNPWVWAALGLSMLIMIIAYHVPLLEKVLSLVQLSTEQFITVGLFGISALGLAQIIKRLGGTV
mgnify:CR=1 FL=1